MIDNIGADVRTIIPFNVDDPACADKFTLIIVNRRQLSALVKLSFTAAFSLVALLCLMINYTHTTPVAFNTSSQSPIIPLLTVTVVSDVIVGVSSDVTDSVGTDLLTVTVVSDVIVGVSSDVTDSVGTDLLTVADTSLSTICCSCHYKRLYVPHGLSQGIMLLVCWLVHACVPDVSNRGLLNGFSTNLGLQH